MMSNDKTSGNNDGNEDDTRHAFYTSSRYRTTEPLVEDTDKRKHTLRSALSVLFKHLLEHVKFQLITGGTRTRIGI
jgi:hypothetical protein